MKPIGALTVATGMTPSTSVAKRSIPVSEVVGGYLCKKIQVKLKLTNIVWEGVPAVSTLEPEQVASLIKEIHFEWGDKNQSFIKLTGLEAALWLIVRAEYGARDNYQSSSELAS